MTTSRSFYIAGGSLPSDALSYIVRNADHQLFDALERGQFCYVLTSRQIGKSSLMVRTATRLRREGTTCLVLDLTAIGQNMTESQWYDGLLNLVARQLDLEEQLDAFWTTHTSLGPLQRWMLALEEVVLPTCDGRLVLFIDEIDAVRSLPFNADGFFAAIRECYNRRSQDQALEGLTFCLLGVASPSDLVRDTRTTPFNIGTRIDLTDFSYEEAAPLAEGVVIHGGPLSGAEQQKIVPRELLARILYWTGGHPYLTQRLCQAIAETLTTLPTKPRRPPPALVDPLCQQLFLSDDVRHRDDNLLFVRQRLLHSEADRVELLDMYGKVWACKRIMYDEANPLVEILRLSGIVRVQEGYLRVRNRIYAQVFDRAWIAVHMPDAALRRQRIAYRQGQLRALTLSSVVVAVVIGLAAHGFWQAHRATRALEREQAARDEAEHLLYIANMNLIQENYASNDFSRVQEWLGQTRDSRFRNFEWGYWQRPYRLDLTPFKGHNDRLGNIPPVAFSPDRTRLVTGCWDGTAKVWDTATGKNLLTLRGHSDLIWLIAFSLDGKRIVTGNADKTAKVWDASTGHMILTLTGHDNIVRAVAFSPDGKQLVTGSRDGTARVWDATTGHSLLTFREHHGDVTCVAFSPDGKRIATGSNDKTAMLWDGTTGQKIQEFSGHDQYVFSIAFSPDGKRLATGGWDDRAKIWDTATGKNLLTLIGHANQVTTVAFSPDGKHLVTAAWDNTAMVWDAATGDHLHTLPGGQCEIASAAFSPDGKRMVTGGADKTAKVWDVATGQEILTLTGHDNIVRSVAFSPDGKRLVTGSRDGTARVWDAITGRSLLTLRGHHGDVTCVAFSPDGRRIATGSDDNTTMLWNGTTGEQQFTLHEHTDRVTSVAFSPDGRRIVTGSGDNTAIVWNADMGRKMSKLYGHTDQITSVAFSPDGKRIVTGSWDDRVRLWDADMGRAVLTLQGHFGHVNSVAFSADGAEIRMKGVAGGETVWYSDRFKGTGPTATLRPYQISAGEGGVAPFSSDAFFAGGSTGSFRSGVNTDGLLNPAPQAVYQSERFGIAFRYTFPGLDPGADYTVRLHFAEIYFKQPGVRLFNVKINGNQVLTHFDVLHSADRANQAIIEQFDISADRDGIITLDFQSFGNGAKVSGIEILPRDYYSRSGWTATASSSAGATPPGSALDGNTGTRWTTGAHRGTRPWFRVDMKSAHSISKIVLDNSNTPYDFPRSYAVYVSNDGLNWGSPIATGNSADVNYLDGTTIPFPTRTARYIQVVQTGTREQAWSISEFYVYP